MLAIKDVSKSFGGVQALRSVAMQIPAGVITSIIGPNGAGKSTLINVISGYTQPTGGAVNLDGVMISKMRPFQICRLGLARSYQNLQMFSDMPAWEVVAAGRFRHQKAGLFSDIFYLPASAAEQRAARLEAEDTLRFLEVDNAVWERRAGDLSYGVQRKLEIGRALATRPQMVLLDEPAAGLGTAETTALGTLLRRIAGSGIGIVLVEHDLDLVMSVSHTIFVMDAGAVIAHGDAESIRSDQRVISAYLGVAHE